MRPVDWAGSVSEILPRHSFLYKNFDVLNHMKRRAGPVTEILVFATEIPETKLEIFPYEHSTPDTGSLQTQTYFRLSLLSPVIFRGREATAGNTSAFTG